MNRKALLVTQMVALALMGSAMTANAAPNTPAVPAGGQVSAEPVSALAQGREKQLLTGHVIWEGRPQQPSNLQALPLILTLQSEGVRVDYTGLVTGADGTFTVDAGSLPAGRYNYRAKGPKYLAKAGTVTLHGNKVTTVDIGVMSTGDANDDNIVDAADFNILRNAFGTTTGDPGYDERADFTGDEVINSVDFNLMRNNYGRAGAPPLTP